MNNRTGEIIEKYRKEKGLTQSELAKKLGVSNTAISKWEHGNNLPDITLLEPLSEILGIDKLILFTSENEAKEENTERIKSQKRNMLIKNSIVFIIFLFSIVFTNYISYKVYNHKLNVLETSKPEIYKFYSKDEEYFVNGYIIFKESESLVIFDQLHYQDTYAKKTKTIQKEIVSAELILYLNNQNVLKNVVKSNKNYIYDTNEVLLELTKNIAHSEDINKNNLNNPEIVLILNNKQNKTKKHIKLEVVSEI